MESPHVKIITQTETDSYTKPLNLQSLKKEPIMSSEIDGVNSQGERIRVHNLGHEGVQQEFLYKKIKHDNVNYFSRFVTLLLLLLVSSLYCHLFGLVTSEWFKITVGIYHRSIGMFFSCRHGVVGFCKNRTSSKFPHAHHDHLTGETICEVSDSTVSLFVNTMWVLYSLNLACIMLALLVLLRVKLRPTRSCSSLIIVCLLLIAFPCALVTAIIFSVYSSCYRSLCTALHVDSPDCVVYRGLGYDFHISGSCLDFCSLLIAFFLCVTPYTLRSEASRLLRERHTLARERLTATNTAETEGEEKEENEEEKEREQNEKEGLPNRILRMLRGEKEKVAHLTATELGVVINGADDWLYDEKSDFFYSFDLDAFWDPVMRRYYSRALRIWHTSLEEMLQLCETRDNSRQPADRASTVV